MIAGIDESGKGPVLGPMCVAGVVLEGSTIDVLVEKGVKDSKKLSPKRREALSSDIRTLAANYYILEVGPGQIDELRKRMTMNELMVRCYVNVLDHLKPEHVFVDAADVNPGRFGENIRKNYTAQIEITSEHSADEKYPVVAAASILAKVRRDALVKTLEEDAGMEIGSGYPGDPKTIRFLEAWISEHDSLPDFARSSWETSRTLLEKFDKRQKRLPEF